MRKIRTHIKGLYIIKGRKFSDYRGWLREVFKKNYFNKNNIFTIKKKCFAWIAFTKEKFSR